MARASTRKTSTKTKTTTKPAVKAAAKPAAKAKAAAKPAAFTGFAKDAPRFFHELAAEMSREWFAAHKPEYEQLWVAPMTAMLDEVRTDLAPAYRGLTLTAPKLFRIHRDVRFAKDKTPYKLHIGGLLLVGAGAVMETGAALYVQLGLEEYAGAGFWDFSPEQLARWRKAVQDERAARELTRVLAAATTAGLTLDAREVLARVPRGLDPDHPRAELLRHKGCVLGFPAIPRGLIHRPAFAAWLTEQARTAAPVVRWLEAHVGSAP